LLPTTLLFLFSVELKLYQTSYKKDITDDVLPFTYHRKCLTDLFQFELNLSVKKESRKKKKQM